MMDDRKIICHKGEMYWEKIIHVPMTGERHIGGDMQHNVFIDCFGFLRVEDRLSETVLVPKIPREELVEVEKSHAD